MNKLTTITPTGAGLTALLGLPLRYCDRKPGISTNFTTDNLDKAITFDDGTITFLDTDIKGLIAIDTLITRLHVKYAVRDVRYRAAKELANIIHATVTEIYPGWEDQVAEYLEAQPDESEEPEED